MFFLRYTYKRKLRNSQKKQKSHLSVLIITEEEYRAAVMKRLSMQEDISVNGIVSISVDRVSGFAYGKYISVSLNRLADELKDSIFNRALIYTPDYSINELMEMIEQLEENDIYCQYDGDINNIVIREDDFYRVKGKYVIPLPEDRENQTFSSKRKQVFIIGSKGIPATYGGFETFVEKLTGLQIRENIRYHVARIATDNERYFYNNAKVFNVKVPEIGSAKAVIYDILALRRSIAYCRKRPSIQQPIFYVLACRIGPFIGHYKKQIKKLGGVLYVNPDGHEWQRSKWNKAVQRYWKLSEKGMVKHADLLICDSRNIEKYIHEEYGSMLPNTTYIAYGSDTKTSALRDNDPKFTRWMKDKGLECNQYYLIVGRFVPENNFETIIREFMHSDTTKKLAIITTNNDAFSEELEQKLHFSMDPRIVFTGTVYDQELLKKIRENAYAYIHGHSVGGTNPSLLEALSSTKLNLLYDVSFNKEVAEDSALYWDKEEGNLAALISKAENLTEEEIEDYGQKTKKQINDAFTWPYIIEQYEKLFTNGMYY